MAGGLRWEAGAGAYHIHGRKALRPQPVRAGVRPSEARVAPLKGAGAGAGTRKRAGGGGHLAAACGREGPDRKTATYTPRMETSIGN